MRKLTEVSCLHIDVFSHSQFYGNPVAVFVLPTDPNHYPQTALQRIANWMNLSETTFVCATNANEYQVRIFTPASELPFAGHPSLGTASALYALNLLVNESDQYTQHCAAGSLPVHLKEGSWFVQAPTAQIQTLDQSARSALELACVQKTTALPIAVVNNGPHWAVAEFESAAQLLEMTPNLNALADWNRRYHNIGLAAFARDANNPQGLEVRCFVPVDGIAEDPVTGSGNAAIAAYLHHYQAFDQLAKNYTARQGRAIGRDGYLQMRVSDQGVVHIGGAARVLMQGRIDLSEYLSIK